MSYKIIPGALEGQHKQATGNLISFSEQNLLDCVYERDGCEGGRPDEAFGYLYRNKGIDSGVSYPYMGKWAGQCNYDSNSNVETHLTGYTYVNGEDNLKAAVATVGPISIGNF